MAAGYLHTEVDTAQSPKKPSAPCGDLVAVTRTAAATTVICADGIGSGVHARIAARMAVSRLQTLLELGHSPRQSVAPLVATMERSRDPAKMYAVFALARVRNDGMATVLSYEMPGPILVSRRHAAVLRGDPMPLGGALVHEYRCFLEADEGLLLMSDGITQAGLGRGLAQGWQTEGVCRFVDGAARTVAKLADLPQLVHDEARRLWKSGGDDCTALLAHCRRGQCLNILTGPPADRGQDHRVVTEFMAAEGLKIVCGGSTASVVAREIGAPLSVDGHDRGLIAPPRYRIPGVDLVTEGAVTLNQVYNLLGEDLRGVRQDSAVMELCLLLDVADRVNITYGRAHSAAAGDIVFRQQGILTRDRILPLLAAKLESAGKLVVLTPV